MGNKDREFQQQFAERCSCLVQDVYNVYTFLENVNKAMAQEFHSTFDPDIERRLEKEQYLRNNVLHNMKMIEILKDAEDVIGDSLVLAQNGFSATETAKNRTKEFLQKREESMRRKMEKMKVGN